MKILLLGASGQIGWQLAGTLPGLGDLTTTTRDGKDGRAVDVSDAAMVRATLDAVRPDLIVNAAAYTGVDQAESEPELARHVNSLLPGLLGEWADANRALVVHYSTDYVYDGMKPEPYVETDTPNPINVYGETKLAGDQALLDSGCAAIVLRVSWIYGARGRNFLLTMQRLMRERPQLQIVDDQIGAPTWCESVADATRQIIAGLPAGPEARQALAGVYHCVASDSTSWYGFAAAIRDLSGLDCELQPIPTSAYPTPAQRPMNSRLDCGKLKQRFGVVMPHWRDALQSCLNSVSH